jgi:hypothetical protein
VVAVPASQGPNRQAPMRVVIVFGAVSMLADFVYEGVRAIIGPFLTTFAPLAVGRPVASTGEEEADGL